MSTVSLNLDQSFSEDLESVKLQNVIQFRRLCPDDRPNLRKLCQEWFPIEYTPRWYELVTNGRYFYPVAAVFGDQIIGIIVADLIFKWDCDECDEDMWVNANESPMVYILALGVVKECRRMGVGSLLLDQLILEITEKLDPSKMQESVCAIFLHVQCSNNVAIRFYEKRSFKVFRYLPRYYQLDVGPCDAFSYVLFLKDNYPTWTCPYSFFRTTSSVRPDLNKFSHLMKRFLLKWRRKLRLISSTVVVYFDYFCGLIGFRSQYLIRSPSFFGKKFRTKITYM